MASSKPADLVLQYFHRAEFGVPQDKGDYRCTSDCISRGPEFDPGLSHTLVEINHEIISTVILLPSAEIIKKGLCQLQAKVCAQITGKTLVKACPGKSVVN